LYGLIKSVDKENGEPLIDYSRDPYGCRALIAQLALATGSPDAAQQHFEFLEVCEDANDYFQRSLPNADTNPFPTEMIELIIQPINVASPRASSTNEDKQAFFERLKSTAPIARRYTFASSDAVKVQKTT
jgi:hypothetical protein